MQDQDSSSGFEYDEDGDRVLGAANLTEQQKLHFEKARADHRLNMTKVQKIGQKVFKGPGFISKPDKIEFKDFDIGKPHFLILTLTNVSNAFNSFNVLPLPQKIRNYFQVMYTAKGKISPGISCQIKFKFLPQINEDIHSHFSILAQTGQIDFPLVCTSKKAIVKCRQTAVDFGKVIEGEVGQAQIKLDNEGALRTSILVKSEDGLNLAKVDEPTRQLLNQVKFTDESSIEGYSQKTLLLSFEPAAVGQFTLNLQLYFEHFAYSPPIMICLKGHCINVPVTIEKPVYDFQICLLNHIYRQKLCLWNSGEMPMSFKVTQPQSTKRFFEFNPIVGYIQKNSKIDIWVKFSANKDLPAYLVDNMKEENIYEIPFKVTVKQQVLPVNFVLRFKISNDQLIISPEELNFGCILEGLSSKIEVTIENQSDIPQQILFYPLKKQICVENDQSLFKILPKATVKKCLIYKSKPLEESKKGFRDEGSISCKIITGDIAVSQLKIEYICETIKPDLSISYNHIDFSTTQIDQVAYASTIFKNNINKQIIFELVVPPYEICGLKVTPVVKVLSPNQELEINIQFHSFMKKLTHAVVQEIERRNKPDKNEGKPAEPEPPKQTKKDVKKQAKLTKAQQEAQEAEKLRLEEEQRARKQKQKQQMEELQRNFDMEQELAKFGGTLTDFGSAQHYKWVLPVYFKKKEYPDASVEVNFIEITTTSTNKILISDQSHIDFGEIAVGARKTQQFVIKNLGAAEMLHKRQLPVFGCFSVLNSLRKIQTNGVFKALVEFQPTENQKFEQKLTIYTSTSSVSCMLRGVGVRPDINIEPESGLLHFGGVLLGEHAEKTFKIKNICNFSVQFGLRKVGGGVLNSNDSNPVMYIPSNGILPPNGSIEVKVQFKPDRIHEQFFEKVKVHVSEQKNERYFYVSGYCYPRQAYVKHYVENKIPRNEEIKERVEYPLDWLRENPQRAYYGPNNKEVILEFTKVDQKLKSQPQDCYRKKLTIGSCKLLDNKLEKPTNFQFVLPKDDRFHCDNPKGTAASGTETVVTFTYKPEPIDPLIQNIPVLVGIGQWKDIKVELKLSGGFVKPGTADAIVLDIILRVYVNQI